MGQSRLRFQGQLLCTSAVCHVDGAHPRVASLQLLLLQSILLASSRCFFLAKKDTATLWHGHAITVKEIMRMSRVQPQRPIELTAVRVMYEKKNVVVGAAGFCGPKKKVPEIVVLVF